MADISKLFFLRHLRGEQSCHLMHWSNGHLVRAGRGLSFWFLPLSASIAEVPIDDRDQTFLFSGRSADFQDFTVQGVITWRVRDPERLASRVDFTLDLATGRYRKEPLDTIAGQLSELAREMAERSTAPFAIRELLTGATERVRDAIRDGMTADAGLADAGLEIAAVRIAAIRPTADLEKALRMPTREHIQQQADQATFARRALAVENERAIAENELHNRIELARRTEQLIAQEGANKRKEATEYAEARRIEVESEAAHTRIETAAAADQVRVLEGAKVEAEEARMEIYKSLPPHVQIGLAAQELATKLQSIEHLSVAPEMFGPLLTQLITAGTRRLEAEGS